MIMAELGRYPLEIIINCKMIGFWLRLVTGNQNKLSFKIHQLMLNIPNFQSKWITHVQTILQLTLVRYRTSIHYLPEETGRWNMTDISERKYLLCNKNDTGEELHYLLTCPFFNDSRLPNVPRLYHNNPNILKFKQLMNTNSRPLLVRLCKFIRIIMETLKQLY